MRPDLLKEAWRWLKQAERDFMDACFVLSGRRYNLCCFLAQQSAEKALKAYLYAKGNEEVWGHSVAELCADAYKIDKDFRKIKRQSNSLDKYYIPTRYPNGLPGGIPSEVYQRQDAKEALTKADRIIKFVKKKIEEVK
ncbi:MAG: HEPN domain-containing protein [Candidatus Omnitrophica bacterium]|nr:HEPN domain-containing protein [Candidatus Omnitrophota bacterium]